VRAASILKYNPPAEKDVLSVQEVRREATSERGFEAAVKATIRNLSRTQKVVGWDVLSLCRESPREGKTVFRADLKIKILVDQ
jgi:hypothetical protein